MKNMSTSLGDLVVATLTVGLAVACGRSTITGTGADGAAGGASNGSGGRTSGGAGGSGAGGDDLRGGAGGGGAGGDDARGGAGGSGGARSDGGTLPACGVVPKPPVVDSCVQPVGGWTDVPPYGTNATRSVKLRGTLTAIAQGPVTGGCFGTYVDTSSPIVVLSVRADGDASAINWDVEYQAPAYTVPLTVGQPIDVTYSESGGGWSPIVSSLILGSTQSPSVYIGLSGTVAGLVGAPLGFRQGSAICLQHDTCGDWSRYELEASDASGLTEIIRYGDTTEFAGYRISHGGVSYTLSLSTKCADWYVADARVAVFKVVN